jgi:hypothetical protein
MIDFHLVTFEVRAAPLRCVMFLAQFLLVHTLGSGHLSGVTKPEANNIQPSKGSYSAPLA